MVGRRLDAGLSAHERQGGQAEARAILDDLVTVTRRAEGLNAQGEYVVTETSEGWRGRIFRAGGDDLEGAALGLSGEERFVVLLEWEAAFGAGDELVAGEWPGRRFRVQGARAARMLGPEPLWWEAQAVLSRA